MSRLTNIISYIGMYTMLSLPYSYYMSEFTSSNGTVTRSDKLRLSLATTLISPVTLPIGIYSIIMGKNYGTILDLNKKTFTIVNENKNTIIIN